MVSLAPLLPKNLMANNWLVIKAKRYKIRDYLMPYQAVSKFVCGGGCPNSFFHFPTFFFSKLENKIQYGGKKIPNTERMRKIRPVL